MSTFNIVNEPLYEENLVLLHMDNKGAEQPDYLQSDHCHVKSLILVAILYFTIVIWPMLFSLIFADV